MSLASIMKSPAVIVDIDDTLETVKAVFDDVGYHHLLVVEKGRLFGIVSDRDMLRALSPWVETLDELPRDHALLKKPIHQICRRRPVSANPKTSLIDCLRILVENEVACLPIVTKQGTVKGIVTWRDIFRALYEFIG